MCTQAQAMQELSRGLGRQKPDALSQSLIPEHFTMDTQGDDYKERRFARPGNECQQPSTMLHNIDQQGTPGDKATGETVTTMTHNNELEG